MKTQSSKLFRLKLMACASTSLFCLSGIGVSTFAWFASNRQVGFAYDTITVNDSGLIDRNGIQCYPAYRNENDVLNTVTGVDYVGSYAFGVNNFGKDSLGNCLARLHKYSLLDSPKGNAILVKIPLASGASASSITVKGFTTASVFEGASGQQLEVSGNSLTSIVDFYCFLGDEVTLNNNAYYTANLNAATKTCFIDSSRQVTSSIDLGAASTMPSCIYIVIDYNIDLLNEVYSQNLGNPILDDPENEIEYSIDFSFSFTEGE